MPIPVRISRIEAPAPMAKPERISRIEAPVPITIDPLNDPGGILAKRSVYFAFDMATVKDADKPILQAHAQYLREHIYRKVLLEGNCDERGSDEYNLALGQRRADSVKKILLLSGVSGSQIDTVSYGEEKPNAIGHDEASWAQNRRTDLHYLN